MFPNSGAARPLRVSGRAVMAYGKIASMLDAKVNETIEVRLAWRDADIVRLRTDVDRLVGTRCPGALSILCVRST